MKPAYTILLCLFVSATANAADDTATKPGLDCFNQYKALEAAYDPGSVSIISDSAKIEFNYTFANGKDRTEVIPTSQFKQVSLHNLPKVKQAGEKHTYTNIKIVLQGDKYLVTGDDYSSTVKMQARFASLFSVDAQKKCTVDDLKFWITLNQQPQL